MKILIGKFIKVPNAEDTTQEEMNNVFSNMLGHTYRIYESELNKEYVILEGIDKESEKEYEESIYKSLIALGEDEEYARGVAKGTEEVDGCMYFKNECFEIERGQNE